jgi:plastocyanin
MGSKRNLILIIAAVAIVALAVVVAYWVGESRKEEVQPTKVTPAEAVKSTAKVEITAKGFSPATISVKKGTLHPTHTNLAGFDSVANLKTNDTYSFLFEKTATYTYHDELNPLKFKGTVVVK